MNKREFIEALSGRLAALPHGEVQPVLNFYAEAIDDRVEDGMDEAAAVAAMGGVEDIAAELLGGAARPDLPPVPPEPERSDSAERADALDDRTVRREYAFSAAGVDAVDIRETSSDVRIGLSEDEQIHVSCLEGRGARYDFEQGRTLRIVKHGETIRRFLGISLHVSLGGSDDLIVRLPERLVPSLTIGASSGDVELNAPRLAELRVHTGSGDVSAENALTCTGAAEITAGSGDIETESLRCETLKLSSGSGDLQARALRCGALRLSTASGDLNVEDAEAELAEIATGSGDIEAAELRCDMLRLSSASGDVNAGNVTAREVVLSTVSGGVKLENAAVSERLNSHTVSGDLECVLCAPLPQGRFESVSGDIRAKLAGRAAQYRLISGKSAAFSDAPAAENTIWTKTVSGDVSLRFDD